MVAVIVTVAICIYLYNVTDGISGVVVCIISVVAFYIVVVFNRRDYVSFCFTVFCFTKYTTKVFHKAVVHCPF